MAQEPLHRALGLTDGEHERICSLLAREPNDFELAVFSLLWSEHCGYKHSALLLKRLPSEGERVLQGPGENAGVLDLDDGLAVAFKVESHNHPSAVEPFQGAATGVGGILRDIIAMGARPVALLDGLRFAESGLAFSRAVGGIGAYGNSVGVPTVGGEAVFDEAYRDNCLVNAMCVGLLPVERVMRAKATGSGQVIVLYGATTGRDGIGGASVLASQELDGSHDKRPSVQIGDPFTGKKLIEASVELVQVGLVESLQDCGAAGIASALSEMAADYGIDVHLDQVLQREEGMEPWEVMISESQERMVAIVRPQMVEAVEQVLDRWELGHSVIGEVTASGDLRAFWQEELVGEIPARFLTEDCPRYDVIFERRPATPELEIADPPRVAEALPALLASPNLRSREFVFRRYDQLVGSRTVRRPGLDAAVLRLRPSLRGLALSLDGQGRIARLDPFTGGALAVLEAARNVACAGGEPLGLTDCLNFGNPEKPEIGWELTDAINGMAAACDALGLPIVSGNVSLYNETNGHAIHPTPVVGAVGLVPDVRRVPKGWREGDSVLLAEASPLSLAGSEYQAVFGQVSGTPGPLDLEAEARLISFLWEAAPLCSLVHDSSDGGLAVCLAEAALFSGCGAELTLDDGPLVLFGEVGGRAVLACASDVREDVRRLGAELGVPVSGIGVAGGDTLLGVELAHLRSAFEADL